MTNLKDFGAKVKANRLDKNLTQEELAKRVGYTSRSSINKIERGYTDIPQSKIMAIASELDVSPAYLLGLDSNKEPKTIDLSVYDNISNISIAKIPMLGEIACGKPIQCNEEIDCYVDSGTDVHADFCLKCKGDSMTGARIFNGDIVFIKKQPMVDNGEIAAVIIDNEATLKRFFYYPEKAKLVLQAENPAYEPLVFIKEEINEITILGKAVAFQSDVK